jgi:hypothetical protein
MGMLATMINSLALQAAPRSRRRARQGARATAMPALLRAYTFRRAIELLEPARRVIGGGTGNPFFTTDSAAALRAPKSARKSSSGHQGRWHYDADPVQNPKREVRPPYLFRGARPPLKSWTPPPFRFAWTTKSLYSSRFLQARRIARVVRGKRRHVVTAENH